MNILFLGKSTPTREVIWIKALKKVNPILKIDIVEFSERSFLELEKDISDKKIEKLINSKISFINFVLKNYKEYDLKTENEIIQQLKFYEEKYKMNYNFILNCDRTIIYYKKKKIKILLLLLTIFSEQIILENNYTKIIGEFSSSSDIIFYTLAKFYEIEYKSFCHGRIENRISIENIDGNRSGLAEKYLELKKRNFTQNEKKILKEYFKKISVGDIIPDYEKYNKKSRKFSIILELKKMRKNLKNIIRTYGNDSKYSCDMPNFLKKKIEFKWNQIKYPLKKYLEKGIWEEINYNERFLLVPLHFTPEVTTMTFAQEYLDQIHHIKRLSQSIPIDYCLYVKEHPSMYIYRKKSYYDEIKKLHNVKLISPFENQLQLLKSSMGVITLTNTTGYEGILYKKPVYLFGKVFYQEYDFVNKIKSYSELKELITKNENYQIEQHNYESFILATLLSLKEGNYNLVTLDPTALSDENGINIAKIILEE